MGRGPAESGLRASLTPTSPRRECERGGLGSPTLRCMDEQRASDPADIVVAWEAVEELLAPVPEGPAKDVLRLVAAGLPIAEIAARLRLVETEVTALVARGRIRVLTAALAARG